jgi:hypothetical protein
MLATRRPSTKAMAQGLLVRKKIIGDINPEAFGWK